MNTFFAALYELITGRNGITEALYDYGLYLVVGMVMLLISLVGMIVYYYAVNHLKFNRWIHWLISVIFVSIINFLVAYFNAGSIIYDLYGEITDFVMEMIGFGFANAIWTFVFCFIFSLCIKWKSRNCSRTPF